MVGMSNLQHNQKGFIEIAELGPLNFEQVGNQFWLADVTEHRTLKSIMVQLFLVPNFVPRCELGAYNHMGAVFLEKTILNMPVRS